MLRPVIMAPGTRPPIWRRHQGSDLGYQFHEPGRRQTSSNRCALTDNAANAQGATKQLGEDLGWRQSQSRPFNHRGCRDHRRRCATLVMLPHHGAPSALRGELGKPSQEDHRLDSIDWPDAITRPPTTRRRCVPVQFGPPNRWRHRFPNRPRKWWRPVPPAQAVRSGFS